MNHQIIKGMPAEEYFALQRLSASGIKKILVSAQDFYATSWMNHDKEEKKSDVFRLGTAYHKRILEGKPAFDKSYAIEPECDKRTKDGKAVYASWLLNHPGCEGIDDLTYRQINAAAANDLECFKGGDAELTILWDDEDTGVPMKSRFDYLKEGRIYDLKTFSNSSDMDINRLIAGHIVKYKYHVQSAVYCEAIPMQTFTFVFQQTGAVNNAIVRHFPAGLMLADQGRRLMRQGINKFADCYRKFGTKPWTDDFGVECFTDESFPIWSYEE